jgi:FKBP-type peptidyl-prolyl cis-trans isomerase
MRLALVVTLAAGLAVPALAQDSGQKKIEQTQAPAAQPAKATPVAAPTEPPANPNAKPVPNMPVVKKTDLADGIVAEDMKIGEGFEIPAGGAVVVHYHGMLKDGGKVFDSSYSRGEPIAFPLSGVIPGWQKGVPGMKVGGIRKLTIPSKEAYGERGAGADIPPNSDLVFIIEVLDAVKFTDTKVGDGEAASGQCVAVAASTVKDAEGKVVESADAAHPYIWIPGELQGLSYGLEGMKVGGKRTITIPKEMNPAIPGLETKRPSGVALTVELELIAIRNLPSGRRR